ncbi:MAG TPA: aldo/keto reductase [Candidatus Acidoferrales bacterium]|nr:aldo/keto reductase [Candidatus Acidoferrales bacterium]
MKLTDYVTMGRSGLRVSPVCLGTMTFGNEEWGSDENTSRAIFDRYLEAGGNFLDTADLYAGGKSEELLAKFIGERGMRDRVVIATKFTFNGDPGNPNAGGNGRKNIYRALEDSLRRLKTDYVDLYYQHVWDIVTPVEEVVETLTELVREGKIRYYGFSDTPAWYVARAQTIAEKEGKSRAIALQLEYSLVERNIEREHIPAAQELGIGICPWSPLAAGFLSGKYKREGNSGQGGGLLEKARTIGGPVFDKFTDKNWTILNAVEGVAKQIGKSPAQVALSWIATQPGVTSTILGARGLAQFEENLAGFEFTIPDELREKLDDASALPEAHPYMFFGETLQSRVNGGTTIEPWKPARIYKGTSAASEPAKTKASGATK